MAKLIQGQRIGKLGELLLGCSAVIFDQDRHKVLLTRRTDNGQWCLPGGRMEPGESAAEACAREIWEETGLQVEIRKLLGVYSSPDRLIEYADGNRFQVLALNFEAEPTGGELRLSNETTGYGYFSPMEIAQMDVMAHHLERIADAFNEQAEAYIR
jgi:8-oxo-dGTP pyrophosphatase MutT (NUDIX family)